MVPGIEFFVFLPDLSVFTVLISTVLLNNPIVFFSPVLFIYSLLLLNTNRQAAALSR